MEEGRHAIVKRRGHPGGRVFQKMVPSRSFEAVRELQAFGKMREKEGRCVVKLLSCDLVKKEKGEERKEEKLRFEMEYAPMNLRDLLRGNGEVKEEMSIWLARDICEGVSFMHERGLMHRDIKPENVLIQRGRAKVADFGLSCVFREGERRSPGMVTLWYRPPEILEGNVYYNERVDAWSIGCVFVEMLKGRPLFPGKSEMEVMDMILKKGEDMSVLMEEVLPFSRRSQKFVRKSVRRWGRRSVHHLLNLLIDT